MLTEPRIRELLDYTSSYGEFDEDTPNGTVCEHGGDAMCDERRGAIKAFNKVLEK